MTTHMFHVLLKEDDLFSNNLVSAHHDSRRFDGLYSTTHQIHGIFDRSLIPSAVIARFLKAVRQVSFQKVIYERANQVSDSLIHPSIGVHVRSWQAQHELEDNRALSRSYSQQSYENTIHRAILHHLQFPTRIKSVLFAFDNFTFLSESFKNYFANLSTSFPGIQIVTFEQHQKLPPMEKAALEMLALSKTNILIGNDTSTFFELAWWFGECRQSVYLPH